MTFRKYSSLDNHYQSKILMRWISQFPELAEQEFVLEEKLDGANIQIYAVKGADDVQVGKRSSFVGKDENFFGLWELIEGPYRPFANELMHLVNKSQNYSTLRVFGEIFGPGIQKRINYSVDGPQIAVFDVLIDDRLWVPPQQLHSLSGWPLVPIIDRVQGINEALEYNREFKSLLSDEDNAEGFVMKPWKQHFVWGTSRFVMKGKSEQFAEKMKVKVKERKELPSNVLKAFTDFRGYATDNRLDNVIGNNGPLESPSQIGEYIKLMIADMKKDFIADGFDESKFEAEELKKIYNVGHMVVPLIKARL